MSGRQRQSNDSGGSIWKTVATLGAGVIMGAAGVYLASKVEPETPHRSSHTTRQYSSSNASTPDEKEKDFEGVIQTCEICFISFEEIKKDGGHIVSTPCGHVFCKDCIVRSLRTVAGECPHCRHPMTERQLKRLFI